MQLDEFILNIQNNAPFKFSFTMLLAPIKVF